MPYFDSISVRFNNYANEGSRSIIIEPMRLGIWRLCVRIFCGGLIGLLIVSWLNNFGYLDTTYSKFIRAGLLSLMILCVLESYISNKATTFPIGRLFLLIGFVMLFYALFSNRLLSESYYVSRVFFWIVGSFFIYRMTIFGIITEKVLISTISCVVLIGAILTAVFILYPGKEASQNIGIYGIVWCLPFVMIIKKKTAKILIMMIACFSIVLSLKRGAIIAMIASLCSYTFVYFMMNRNIQRAMYTFMIGMVSLFIVVSTLFILKQIKPVFVSNRLREFSYLENYDKVGSGRGDFYVLLINKYLHSVDTSKLNLIFGFGSRSTQELISMHNRTQFDEGAYAHSDWLQFMYDYGLLGIFIITLLHVWIFRLISNFYAKRHPYTAQLTMCYTIMFLKNIYSGMLFFPQSIYFSMFIAYVYANQYLNHND